MCEQESICLCEQIHTLSKEKMQNFYCSVTPEEMEQIDKALVTTLGIDLNNRADVIKFLHIIMNETLNEGLTYDEYAEKQFSKEEFNDMLNDYRLFGNLFGALFINKILKLFFISLFPIEFKS